VELAGLASDALRDDAGVAIDEDAHLFTLSLDFAADWRTPAARSVL
jgi:hypothetical protein